MHRKGDYLSEDSKCPQVDMNCHFLLLHTHRSMQTEKMGALRIAISSDIMPVRFSILLNFSLCMTFA